jgi:TRAP-type C4-dicarboxylate transport system permease small subunit
MTWPYLSVLVGSFFLLIFVLEIILQEVGILRAPGETGAAPEEPTAR